MKLYELISAEKALYGVDEMCSALGVSRSGYYAHRTRKPSARARDNERLTVHIRAIHRENYERYGSPRVHAELVEQGIPVGENRVAKLMRESGLRAVPKKRFRATTDSKHDDPIAPNLLERDFTAAQPDAVWVGDITYVWTAQGWSYLAVLIDLYSRRVVGWSLKDTLSRELAITALTNALRLRRPSAGLIHHTDRGCQYASRDYRRILDLHGVHASMSRKGNCWDNAVAESFFATIKKELIHRRAFLTRTEAYDAISHYIENFYNAKRRHSTLGNISPNAKEQMAFANAA